MSDIPEQRRVAAISSACRTSASPGDCQRGCAGYADVDPSAVGRAAQPDERMCEHVCHDSVNPRDIDRARVLARRGGGN